jgi:hypothetical protein
MDPAERAALHTRLDQLLDRREEIEAHVIGRFSRNLSSFHEDRAGPLDPRAAYKECVCLARAVAGPIIPWRVGRRQGSYSPVDRSEAETLADLRDWLNLLSPLLKPNGDPPELPVAGPLEASWRLGEWPVDVDAIETELFHLIQGGTSDLFAPARRLPGQSAKPYLLATARMFALVLDRLYAQQPVYARTAAATWRARIAAAFGVGAWGTIEKWEGLCRRHLGDWQVDSMLRAASVNTSPEQYGLDLDEATRACGARFQQVARALKGGDRNRRQPRKPKAPTT